MFFPDTVAHTYTTHYGSPVKKIPTGDDYSTKSNAECVWEKNKINGRRSVRGGRASSHDPYVARAQTRVSRPRADDGVVTAAGVYFRRYRGRGGAGNETMVSARTAVQVVVVVGRPYDCGYRLRRRR